MFVENGKWRIRAVAMLVEEEGKILLVREDEVKEELGKYPNMLSIPMGHIEGGENPPAAALREFSEETGLTAEIDYPLGFFQFELNNRERAAVWVYKGHLEGDLRETSSVVWLDEQEFLSLDPFLLRPLNHEIFQLYSVVRYLCGHNHLGPQGIAWMIQHAMPKASHWTPS